MRRFPTLLGLLSVACLLGQGPAFADRFQLGLYEEAVIKQLRRDNPGWSREQARTSLLAYYPPLGEVTAGVPPEAIKRRSGGIEIVGRALQRLPGLRQGSPLDMTAHDRLLVEAGFGEGGAQVRLSAFNINAVIPHIDTPEDFTWLFSNRHSLVSSQPGSAGHRRLIYTLVDPDGTLGLVDRPTSLDEEDIVEGAYTNYLLHGRPSADPGADPAADPGADAWDRGVQFRLTPANDGKDDEALFDDWFIQFLGGAARSRKFEGYDPRHHRWSIQSLDLMCGMRFIDPGLVQDEARAIAERALGAGKGCFTAVAWGLAGGLAQTLNEIDPDRLLSDKEVRGASLDLVRQSAFLKQVVLTPGDDGAELNEPGTAIYLRPRQPTDESSRIMRYLLNIAADDTDAPVLAEWAEGVIENWLAWGQKGPADNERRWRDLVWANIDSAELVETDALKRTAFELLCEAGWSVTADLEEQISDYRNMAWARVQEQPGQARSILSLVSIMANTAPSQGGTGRSLAEHIRAGFSQSSSGGKDQALWEMWLEVEAEKLNCRAIRNLDTVPL